MITIEEVDEATITWLEAESRRRGVPLEKLIVQLLHEAINLQSADLKSPPYHDLDALAGSWTDDEAQAFEIATAEFRQVDKDIWC